MLKYCTKLEAINTAQAQHNQNFVKEYCKQLFGKEHKNTVAISSGICIQNALSRFLN